jgi:hypothetical protein
VSKLLLSTSAILALTTISWAQVSSEPANAQDRIAAPTAHNSAARPDTLPPGTVLSVELSSWLDAKKSKVNDKVEARTVNDLLVSGQNVVPRNTKIIGHVTEVKAHSKTSPDSMVGITFDRVLLKDGREIQSSMIIQAIAPPLHMPVYGGGPDTLADKSTKPYQLPPVGAQAPATGSSSLTPDYPDNIPAPPSINTAGPRSSTVSRLTATSRGVVGMKGLLLNTSGSASVLSSDGGNVHLDSSTQLTLRVQ